MNNEEKIKMLNKFKDNVEAWDSRANNSREIRTFINENIDWVQREVDNAGCFHTLTIGPPPAVGGLVMQNINPFLMLFNPPYGMSMVGHIVDMIERAVGIIRMLNDGIENNSVPATHSGKLNLLEESMIAEKVKAEFVDKLLSIKKATELHNEYSSPNSAMPVNEAVNDLRIFMNVNRGIVRNIIGVDKLAEAFNALKAEINNNTWVDFINTIDNIIESMTIPTVSNDKRASIIKNNNSVFIVHGHDENTKIHVARFIEKLGLQAIILHEQPNQGRTIIEKFEDHAANSGFAVILLTPDDIAAPKDHPDSKKMRARQNVILELGYFCCALGRKNVCVLHKGEIEIPSDYLGIVYINLDDNDGWRLKLAKEMKAAGLNVDINNAL